MTPSTIEVTTRQELLAGLSNAVPGTKILIAPGQYRGGLSFAELKGTPTAPIIISALDPESPPVFRGGNTGLHLIRPSHVRLSHLCFDGATGNGINVDDGGDTKQPAQGLLIRHIEIRNIGPKGNRDGIKLSGVDNFSVEDCMIETWGDGGSGIDMVGCHNGKISACRFKHRSEIFGNGVQTKGGSANILIRGCRFENAGSRAINLGGSTGRAYFRPGNATYEARNITVEDCTFIGSMAPIAFVGVDGATVRHNTVYRPTRWIIRILQESQGADMIPCREGTFTNNLIVFRSNEIRAVVNIGNGTAPNTFTFKQNHWFCSDNPQQSDRLHLPTRESGGIYGVKPIFSGEETGNLRLVGEANTMNAGARNVPNEMPITPSTQSDLGDRDPASSQQHE